jgi:UDP-N-acetylglucosamine 1-carboxyvinyltransferase
MTHFEITGGIALCGEVRCSGAKNAALPMMAAAILADGPVRLENVPQLTDVRTQARVLSHLGMRITQSADMMTLTAVDTQPIRAPEALVRRMRASFCVLGPLLARRGRAIVPLPGGCNIGNRPVDLHLKGLAALGADLRLEHGCVVATARRLTGATIDLRGRYGPTVTGTANVMSAAVLARDVTVLHGAAIEPEVVDLGKLLIAMGAKIEGLGTPTLRIEGGEQLGGATHRLIPDRIEAATLLLAVAITGGEAMVVDVTPDHLSGLLEKLHETGADIAVGKNTAGANFITLAVRNRLQAVDISARPYPGIPTDVQAQWTALASVANGVCRVRDEVFPGRFLHAAELNRLGACVICADGEAIVRGVKHLSGARVTARDLRASAALVLAGLVADGCTTIEHIHHLDRGYERLDSKLQQLGARIQRITQNGTCDQQPRRITDRPERFSSPADRVGS